MRDPTPTPTVNRSYRYLIQEAVLFLAIIYLFFFGSSKSGLVNSGTLVIDAVFFTLVLVFFLLRGTIAKKGKTSPHGGIDLPMAVMMVVMLVSSLLSLDPRRSMAEFWLVGYAIILFFLVSELVSLGWESELVVKVLLLVGAIFMGMSWVEPIRWYLQWIAAYPGVWIPKISYRLPNPNFLAVMFNVWLMLALARLWTSRTFSARLFLGAFSLSAIGLIYLTSSRGGWLGTAAGLVCLGFLALRTRKGIISALMRPILGVWDRIKQNRRFLAVVGSIFLLAALGLGFLLYRQVASPTHGSRSEFWTPALRAFLDSPLLGKGPFTFISLYLQANSVPPFVPFDYAHSIYMDLLSGSGLAGMLAFLWLAVAVVWALWRRLKGASDHTWAVCAGAMAALAAFCVHGFVDSVHHTAPTSLWNLCIVLGAALALNPDRTAANARENKAPGLTPEAQRPILIWIWRVVFTLLVVCLAWMDVWGFQPLQAGVDAANSGDWAAAAEQFSLAETRDGRMAIAHQQEGMAQAMLAAAGDANALAHAIPAFERAVAIDPYWALNQANLGALYRASGRLDAARAAFEQAVKLAPLSAPFQLNLGAACEDLGDLKGAEAAYRKALSLYPEWRQAYFWRANPFRQAVQHAWQVTQPTPRETPAIPELEKTLSEQRWILAPYLDLGRAYLEQGQLDKAGVVLRQAELAYSLNTTAKLELDWLKAELAAANGDLARAATEGEAVLDNYLSFGLFGPGSQINPAYAVYMFRRPAATLDLIPQMEVISLPDRWGERLLKIAGWYDDLGDSKQAAALRMKALKDIPDLQP